MVIDDEESIRSVTKQTLEAFGYRVLCACDGAEAVALYAQRHAEIALVLTDMMMPIMDGSSLIQVLSHLNPAIKIIAASGMNGPGDPIRATLPNVRQFLTKPYTAAALLRALAETLHA